MKILVINVSLRPQLPEKLFPIGLGYITTALKNSRFDFDLLDIDDHRYDSQYIEKFIEDNRYDVVCMGCIVTGFKIIKSLASLIRKIRPQAKIILGNSVATSISNILLTQTEVDIAVMGEGDETIVELLQAISGEKNLDGVRGICFVRDDKIISTPLRPVIKDISRLPFIDYSIFDAESYIQASKLSVSEPLMVPRDDIRALPVNTARGCIADCGFCYHVFRGLPYRYRSTDSIVCEIKYLIDKYALNYIHFWDELTFFSKKQTLELVEKIIEEGLHFYWTALCRPNLFTDDADMPIIKKMKESGCVCMGFALESADPEILKAMKKHSTVEQFSKQTELFHRAGIRPGTSLVLGYPQETPETIRNTFDCCIQNRIFPSIGYLLPQPGSPMYEYALEKGFIKNEEDYLMSMGDRQDLRINMTSMSDIEFQKNVLEGVKRCNDVLKLGLDESRLIKSLYIQDEGIGSKPK